MWFEFDFDGQIFMAVQGNWKRYLRRNFKNSQSKVVLNERTSVSALKRRLQTIKPFQTTQS